MVGAVFLLFLAGMATAQSPPEGEAAPAQETVAGPTDGLEIPDALRNDPRLQDPLDFWGREVAYRDSLQHELDGIHGRAQIIGLRIRNLERDPKTLEPKDRAQHERLLSEGEKIREEEDRISVELALSRQRIRLAARELTKQLDLVIQDIPNAPSEVMAFRERLLAWEGEVPILPTVEVIIRADDTPDVLREKAGYLRDLADGLDGLADVLQRRLENLRWQQRLFEGAEQILEDESLFDDGASWQDQGEAPLRVRVEGQGVDEDFARGGSVLFVTPDELSWELSDLLEARPSTGGEMRSLRTLLQGAVQEVAFQRDSIRARAGLLEEEASEREAQQ
jgi:hypothetical protein